MRSSSEAVYPSRFALASVILLAFVGCQRERIPSYSEAVELKIRADDAKDMKDPVGDLAYLRTVSLGDTMSTIGRDSSNSVVLEHWGTDPLQLRKHGDGLLILNTPGEVTFDRQPIKAGMKLSLNDSGPGHWLRSGNISMRLYIRDKTARGQIFDGDSTPIQQFHGMSWYPPKSKYRVNTEWIPIPPGHTLVMPRTHGGSVIRDNADGYIAFTIDGRPMSLYASVEAYPSMKSRLFLVFRDLTSKTETYQLGRFLFIAFDSDCFDPARKFNPKKRTRMAIDFNQAQNPPCAYNPNTNCPVAPPENRLSVAIPAGEKRHLPSA